MKEISEFYGSQNTPCTIFYYNGWYCVEGSVNVNYTIEDLENGVNIENVSDIDVFTWSSPINSLDELIDAVEN